MVRIIHHILYILCILWLFSCDADSIDEVNDVHPRSMKMIIKAKVKQFDIKATRGGDEVAWEWQDGDVIYLQYHVGDKLVRGHAVYLKETDSWEAFYNGTLASTEQCEVYFFEGASTADKKQVTLTGSEPIYTDTNASYVVENGEITLSAFLTPLTGRVQFTGAQGTTIKVSGVKYYTGYDAETNSLTTSTEALSRTVATDGYTPYIYGVFADENNREMKVGNSIDGDDYVFVRSFPETVLRIGESGVLVIPTLNSNKGWTDVFVPRLIPNETSVSMEASATSKSITINSNINYSVSSNTTWCTATPSTDYKKLTIEVAKNTNVNRRESTITLKNEEYGLKSTIIISQSPTESVIFTVSGNGKTVSFTMKLVESGSFDMGSYSGNSDEVPVHRVTFTNDYYMGETEVTQALWYAVMGQSPTSDGSSWLSTKGKGNNYPAYYISYDDVESFLALLNTLVADQLSTGIQFRFPTEAEWEFAAKGGNKSKGYTYSGNNSIGNVAWYTNNSSSSSHPVKEKSANELGLYDMSGNVFEWCYDWYGSYPSSDVINPCGPDKGTYRVGRGGSWLYPDSYCRTTYRVHASQSNRNNNLGFRLAL